jgi:hypothetical protein
MTKSVLVAFSVAILGFSIYGLYVPSTVLESFMTINAGWTYGREGVALFFLAFALWDNLRQNFLRLLTGVAGVAAIVIGVLSFVALNTLVMDFFVFAIGGIFGLLASLELQPSRHQLITARKLAEAVPHLPKPSTIHLSTLHRKATV